jgi:hypothetical protein
MTDPSLTRRLAQLRRLLADKAEAGPGSLRAQLARAGRRLPRFVRRDGRFLAEAEAMARDPRLARLIDPRELRRAHARVARHLRGLDLAAARRRRRLDRLALVGFYVFVALGLVLAVALWRGLV